MTPLEAEIRGRIARSGPIPVRQFVELCLGHPQHGYYMTRDPFGRDGDFITAPEVSQVFGELLGLWAAAVWQSMGEPDSVRLVELGPGRGTMMLDTLRAIQIVPSLRKALAVHLVETSPVLRQRQEQRMAVLDVPVAWHDSLDQVPDGRLIVLANELFDALPVNQAIKQFNGWYERTVEIDAGGQLVFGLADDMIPSFDKMLPADVRNAPVGAIYEWRTDGLARTLAERLVQGQGAALVIDYGHLRSGTGDTLQAVANHGYVSPLASPGEVDLTAHVDFEAFARTAMSTGAQVSGPVEQGTLLRRLGIVQRAATLRRFATGDKATEIDAAVERLIGKGTTGMGTLFKAIGLGHPSLGTLPGFESTP